MPSLLPPRGSEVSSPPPQHIEGFTLIELLVAASVLVLLVVLTAQMITNASKTSRASAARLETDSEARTVLDRMAEDFKHMVRREDVDGLFTNSTDGDQMYIYSGVPGFLEATSNASPVSLVGYSVVGNQLWRYSRGCNYDTTSTNCMQFLTVTGGSTNGLIATPATGDTNSHLLSADVFRMTYSFLMTPNTTNTSGGTNSTNTYSQTRDPAQGFKDVSAIVVTIALLDQRSLEIVGSNTLSTFASSSMPDGTNAGVQTNWNASIASSSADVIPTAARSQIRVYQRFFYLDP